MLKLLKREIKVRLLNLFSYGQFGNIEKIATLTCVGNLENTDNDICFIFFIYKVMTICKST